MATGGAWQSEAFDNGRGYKKPVQHATEAGSGGTPPAIYNAPVSSRAADGGAFGALALSLRVAQIVLTILAFGIMAANKETIYRSYYSYYSSYRYVSATTVDFSTVKAFVGVLALNCIVCLYAVAQLVHSIVNMSTKGSFVSSATTGFALLTFIFDTVLAYALLAASAAGADSAAIFLSSVSSEEGSLKNFAQKAEASVAMSFLAFAVLASSAALYPIRLRKLAMATY